ncbi:hypothetical protein LXL04_020049 [Taraxacum kok-saghyz]
MVLTLWKLRSKGEEQSNVDLKKLYNRMSNFFSLKIHHGGMFTTSRSRRKVDGTIDFFNYVDTDLFSVHEVDAMVKELGYMEKKGLNYHFLILELDLDFGLLPLVIDGDVHALSIYVPTTNRVIEHGQTRVTSYFQTIDEEPLGKDTDVISDGSSEEDIEDNQSKIMFDEEPMIDDVHVNMINFSSVYEDIDLGYFAHATNDMQVHEDIEDDPLEVLDNDLFESIASEQELRKKMLKSILKPIACSQLHIAIPNRSFLPRSNPGIKTVDLGHIGGSNHSKKEHLVPTFENVQNRRPGLRFVQEVFTIAALPQWQNTMASLFFWNCRWRRTGGKKERGVLKKFNDLQGNENTKMAMISDLNLSVSFENSYIPENPRTPSISYISQTVIPFKKTNFVTLQNVNNQYNSLKKIQKNDIVLFIFAYVQFFFFFAYVQLFFARKVFGKKKSFFLKKKFPTGLVFERFLAPEVGFSKKLTNQKIPKNSRTNQREREREGERERELGSFENSYIPENPRTSPIYYISQTVISFKKLTSEPFKTFIYITNR